jgi:folate-binding protein YgfZ
VPNLAGATAFATQRYGAAAWDVLTPIGAATPSEITTLAELDAQRIAAGIPAVPVDCGANEFPQECGLDTWVSYTKGCYLGQEVMARIQSLGSLRRILRRVAGPVSVGQELKSAEGKVLGTVRSAAGDVGLALVSVDLPEGSLLGEVRIGAPAQMAAR